MTHQNIISSFQKLIIKQTQSITIQTILIIILIIILAHLFKKINKSLRKIMKYIQKTIPFKLVIPNPPNKLYVQELVSNKLIATLHKIHNNKIHKIKTIIDFINRTNLVSKTQI